MNVLLEKSCALHGLLGTRFWLYIFFMNFDMFNWYFLSLAVYFIRSVRWFGVQNRIIAYFQSFNAILNPIWCYSFVDKMIRTHWALESPRARQLYQSHSCEKIDRKCWWFCQRKLRWNLVMWNSMVWVIMRISGIQLLGLDIHQIECREELFWILSVCSKGMIFTHTNILCTSLKWITACIISYKKIFYFWELFP